MTKKPLLPPGTEIDLIRVSAQSRTAMDVDRFHTDGFLQLSTDPGQSTLEVARSIGAVLHLDGIEEAQTLEPRDAEGLDKNRYSGLYGMSAFPLHTDMAHWHIPPRYFLLRCIRPASNVATHFVHAFRILGSEDDVTLKRALFRPRRRLDGRLTCMRLREGECHRWDPVFIQPVNSLAVDLRKRILERIAGAPKTSLPLTKAGDCFLVDNWKTLHGRAEVPPEATHRKLERVYLEAIRL